MTIITFFVASTNILMANEVNREDFSKKTNVYKLISPGLELGQVDIVEKANLNKNKKQQHISTKGLLIATIPTTKKKEETDKTLLMDAQATTLTATTILTSDVSKKRGETIEYEVQDGDTLSTIADRFNITTNTLNWANGLSSTSTIKSGQKIKIPPVSGILYKVTKDDTIDSIIKKFQGDKEKTMTANDIGEDGLIPIGKEIIIVNGVPYTPPPSVNNASSGVSYKSIGSLFTPNYKPSVTTGKLNWPVGCRNNLTTYWGHANRGRDIACPVGTPIYAAESGTVQISFTGQWGHGYGNALDIYSANGLKTRYAHMSSFNVSSGQYVNRGDVIGFVGMTGRTTGPHLHFEVIINGGAQDPIYYLM